jgi:hypothetical protein
MLLQFDYVKFSMCLIMLYFLYNSSCHYYMRSQQIKSYFIGFHIYKVGVGFTSPSESMRHQFGNDVPHIKL